MATRKQSRPDPNNLTGLRVGLYCRVSHSKRDDPDVREKSTQDQEAVGRRWVEDHGARLAPETVQPGPTSPPGLYSDEGITASRFGRKARAEFQRLIADVEANKLDVVWFWELSRLSRRPSEFHTFQDLCRDNNVLWVQRDRVYDLNDKGDVITLGVLQEVARMESEAISERVGRGVASLAHAGQPHGRVVYGYKIRTEPETGAKLREPNVWDDNGQPIERSPAWVVREMFQRVASGESLNSIARDLNARGIPLATNKPLSSKTRWRSGRIREIMLNPGYIGRRIYQGEVLVDVEAVWPPLVDEEVFWRVHERLTDSDRPKRRPARAKSLLSCLVTCGKCGDFVAARTPAKRTIYGCQANGCSSIRADVLDDYVEHTVVSMLEDPELFATLTKVDDSAVARQARIEASEARGELEQWRTLIDRGEITPTAYARAEKGLLTRISDAEARARSAAMPPALAGVVGPEAEQAWSAAPLEIRRQIIAALVEITLLPSPYPSGAWVHRDPDPRERVEWTPRVGPLAGQVIPAAPRRLYALPQKQAEAVAAIGHAGVMTQAKLGAITGDAAQLVRRLLKRGLITREPLRTGTMGHPTFNLTLTDEGRQALAEVNGNGSEPLTPPLDVVTMGSSQSD